MTAARSAAALAQVCLHEYAHLVVARALGACGFVRIARATVADGSVQAAGAFHLHGDLDDREWRIVALAGTLAEWLAEAGALHADDACRRLAAGGVLSPSDAALAAGHDDDDVRRCLALLGEHWPQVVREAHERHREIDPRAAAGYSAYARR